MTRDSHATGETNLYRYAAGDPTNLTDPTGLSIWDTIASLDNPVSQAVAGALNDAFFGAPADLFGFDPACVGGGAFKFGSKYLSLAVPFPRGKLAAAEKLAAKAGKEAAELSAEQTSNLARYAASRQPARASRRSRVCLTARSGYPLTFRDGSRVRTPATSRPSTPRARPPGTSRRLTTRTVPSCTRRTSSDRADDWGFARASAAPADRRVSAA